MTKRIGVLLSGRGSNFEALAESVAAGRIPSAQIAIVISNKPDARGLERAKARGIETRLIPSKGLEREAYDRQVVAVLHEYKVDLICLAGYMRLLSPYFVAEFPQRILNIHPSLLPSFPGLESQKQALDYGVKVAGCTVHFVDENLDAGPIIVQAVVPVQDTDDEHALSERILKEEHRIYTEAVKIILEGKFNIVGRRVIRRSPVSGCEESKVESEFRTGTIRKLPPVTQQPMQARKELRCSECGAETLDVFQYPDRTIIDCGSCGSLWQILWDEQPRQTEPKHKQI